MSSESSIKILYIEDNPDNYRLVHRALSRAGFEIYWAEEHNAGLEMALQLRPDLILMDINLPGLSGFELTSKFRNRPEFSDVPIIAVSARTQKSDRETALVAGCNGFISKPIDPFNFVSQVRAYLGGRQEHLDKGSEGRALRQFNVHLLEHLEKQLHEAIEANRKLLEAQQTLEAANKSLAGLVSLGQDLVKEYDPWQLLTRVMDTLFLEVPFDTFAIYLQHPSGSYWEGLYLTDSELAVAPLLLPDHPFIRKLISMETGDGWFQGAALLTMPIWTEGYQIDIWQNNGQPCLYLNLDRKNKGYIRGFWAFDRKYDRPFLPRELEMIRLYGRLAQVCLENAEMVREMDEKSRVLGANYENMERAYLELQKAKTELQEKDRRAVMQDLFAKIANHLKEPVATLDQNCQLLLSSVQTDDIRTKQALSDISQFTTQVRRLFQALTRRTQPVTAELPEWINLESLLQDEIEFMSAEGLLETKSLQMDIELQGTRVYGIYSDFARLLKTMLLNSIPSKDTMSLPRQLLVRREENKIYLEVRDSAGPIQQQAVESAFEPFQGQREPMPGRTPHVGLHTCRQILDTYGGVIEMSSSENGVVLKAVIVLDN